jgi:hypothetical protein
VVVAAVLVARGVQQHPQRAARGEVAFPAALPAQALRVAAAAVVAVDQLEVRPPMVVARELQPAAQGTRGAPIQAAAVEAQAAML